MSTLPKSFIVSAKRTPFGSFGGSLKSFKAAQLGGIAGKAAIEAANFPEGAVVDQVYFGGVCQSDNSTPYLARHVGHLSGVPKTTPALTINRLCGSSFQTLITAAQSIALGEASICLTGGTEAMSMSPYTLSGDSRWGTRYGVDQKLEDSLAASLTDQNPTGKVTPMGVTAENLARKYSVTRQECDEYAVQSQTRYFEALNAGYFKDEIHPMPLPTKKDPNNILSRDEHPREATVQGLQKLKSVFEKEGVVTAGNASGICDGASASVVVSEEALSKYSLKPLARIVSYGITACEPEIMGIGPVAAIQQALSRANLTMEDIDLFDVNEAFAAQFLSVAKELKLPMDKTNVFGGAIAVGHPLAASGGRIIANLVHNLRRRKERYAVGGACIGGGQGIAVVLEAIY